jgi:hypothetical protein
MLIPNKHNGYTRDGVRRVFCDDGGGGTQKSTSYTSNVPEYAKEPFMEMIGKGVALSEAPYQAYGGERVSQFTPLQQQAFQQAGSQGVAGQIGQASGIAGLAAQQGLQAGQFQPGTFTPMAVQAPQLTQFQMGAPERVGSQSFTRPGTAEQFMNPYMQSVVDIQKREAQRASDIAGTQRGAQAVRAGAFGGSRQAIMEAEAQRNLAQQMGDIQATGSQAAFQQAQQQFNQEQDARMRAAMANQQAGLTAGGQNLSALLGVQQLGAQTGMQSQMANQQALLDAQRAFEQSRQFGSELGLRGGAQALQGAQTLGQLGSQQFGQEMDIMGARERMGGTQQQQIQRILDQQYADFQRQRDLPYQQLGFLSDLLRGAGSSTRSIYSVPQPSALQTAAGLGTIGAGFMAEGGEVRYADGGITGLLNDQELAQTAQNSAHGPMMQMAAQQQMAENAALREAPKPAEQAATDPVDTALVVEMQKAMNEGDRQRAEALAETVERRREERMAQEEMGIAAVAEDSIGDIPEGGITGMAEGGELSYQAGGPIVLPAGTPPQMVNQIRLENPGVEVRTEDEGAAFRAASRGIENAQQAIASGARDAGEATREFLAYNSDVAAQRQREGLAGAVAASNATDAMRNRSRAALRATGQQRVAESKEKPAAGPRAPAATNPMQQGLGGAAKPRPGSPIQDAMARELGMQQGIAASLMQGADEAIAAQEAAAKERGVFGEEREKRLREQEAGLTDKKGEAKRMALIQAGLSILSADPSRGALAAIGQGAIQGLGAYKGDIKDLEEKRERILEKIDQVADLRRQEQMADGKEKRALIAERNKAITEGQRLMYTTMSRFTDIERDEAKMMFEAAERRVTANIMADRSTEGERLRRELAKHEPGSKEYNRILNDVAALAKAEGAGKPNPILTQRAKDIGTQLQGLNMRLSVVKDPTTRQQLQTQINALQQELDAIQSGGGSTGGAASGTVDANNPLLRS